MWPWSLPGYSCPPGCGSVWWKRVCRWCPPTAGDHWTPRRTEWALRRSLWREQPLRNKPITPDLHFIWNSQAFRGKLNLCVWNKTSYRQFVTEQLDWCIIKRSWLDVQKWSQTWFFYRDEYVTVLLSVGCYVTPVFTGLDRKPTSCFLPKKNKAVWWPSNAKYSLVHKFCQKSPEAPQNRWRCLKEESVETFKPISYHLKYS